MKPFIYTILVLLMMFMYHPFGILVTAYGQPWTPHYIATNLQRANFVIVGDINGDGNGTPDVVATDWLGDNVIGFLAPNWTPSILIDGSLIGAACVKIADIDADNDSDVVAVGIVGGDLNWYENIGGTPPNWIKRPIDSNLNGPFGVDLDDMDGDNDIDIIVTDRPDHLVLCYWNNGGTATNWIKDTLDNDLYGAAIVNIADINNDDTLDIVACGNIANHVVWYEGPLWNKQIIDSNLIGCTHNFPADINNDGKLDIVATGHYANDLIWYKNIDGTGTVWEKYPINSNLWGANQITVSDLNGDLTLDVAVTTYSPNRLLWYSNNGGMDSINWTENIIADNLEVEAVISADMDNDNDIDLITTGWSTGDVIWWENPPTAIGELLFTDPQDYRLYQNYPNPFNPTTNIEFSIPKSQFVTLKIYNILGEEIATLVSERLIAGQYKYEWDASGFSSGIYYYNIEAGMFVHTKKLLYIK